MLPGQLAQNSVKELTKLILLELNNSSIFQTYY